MQSKRALYKVVTDSRYCSFGTWDEELLEVPGLIEGDPVAKRWPLVRLRYYHDQRSLPVGRSKPDFRSAPLLFLCTRECWNEFLSPYHQVLEPLPVEDVLGEYDQMALQLVNRIDVLDEANSDVVRFRSGRLMRVNRYRFYEFCHEKNPLFRIPKLSDWHCTEAFREAYFKAKMTGLEFRELETL